MIATVVIECRDRYVPPSWEMEVRDGETPEMMAQRVEDEEKVAVIRILNSNGTVMYEAAE